MANEITETVGLTVNKTDPTTGLAMVYFNQSTQNRITLVGSSGPYVGAVQVPTTGLNVNLAGIPGGVPGEAWFHNQDPVNSVDVGVKDDSTGKFYPFMRLLPLMRRPVYLSPHLGADESSGAGSAPAGAAHLYMKAYGGTVSVDVQIFPA